MQELLSVSGQKLGVFLTMEEWDALQQQNMNREEWLQQAVHTGFTALHAGDFVPDEEIRELFHQAGADVC